MRNSVLWGMILCFIASFSWGAMFPVAHDAFHYIDPFYFTIIRYGSVAVILVVMLWWKEGKEAFCFEGKGLRLWYYGTMAFTVYNILIFWGEDLLGEPGVMAASVMESMMPMISIVIAWFFLKKQPHWFTAFCVLISFAGTLLVITKGDMKGFVSAVDQIVPSLLLFIAVIGWVVYTMGANDFSGWSPLRYSALSCLTGTLTAGIVVFIATATGYVDIPSMEVIQKTGPHLLFMIIFPGLIALLGWNVGVNILKPVNALLFINFVPVTTLVISLFQGYQITFLDFLGTALIILALVANNIFVRIQMRKTKQVDISAQRQIS